MAESKMARLTQQQFFGLCRAVQANAERYQADRPNFTAVARELAGTLGMAINDVQVRRAAEAAGCLWEPSKTSRGPEPSRTRDMVKDLEAKVINLEISNGNVCQVLNKMSPALGKLETDLEEARASGRRHRDRVDAELAALRGVVVKVAEELGMAIPPGMVPPNGKLPFAVAGK